MEQTSKFTVLKAGGEMIDVNILVLIKNVVSIRFIQMVLTE